MQTHAFHEIWRDQCDAARRIQTRFGTGAALDYLVWEKLLNFVGASATNTAFAQELPGFISEIRAIFGQDQIRKEIARIEFSQRRNASDRRRPSASRAAIAMATATSRLSLVKEVARPRTGDCLIP